ncbi:hypothetical protein [Chroococcidiopsis thermalis]|uniref:hypothetical protein n=1 Tax=Chroococcidiopsis thermalis TaxID=54299 RepID=UPI003CCBBADC
MFNSVFFVLSAFSFFKSSIFQYEIDVTFIAAISIVIRYSVNKVISLDKAQLPNNK